MLIRFVRNVRVLALTAIIACAAIAGFGAIALASTETANAAVDPGCGPSAPVYDDASRGVAVAFSTDTMQNDASEEMAPHSYWRTRCSTRPGYYRTVTRTRRTCNWERVENPGGAGSSLERVCRNSTYRTREWVPARQVCYSYRPWHPHIIWHR